MERLFDQIAKNKFVILLFFVALASGFFWNQKMFGQPIGSDQTLYDSVAQNLLLGKGFVYNGQEVGIEPLYPLFLAGIYGVFGHNYNVVRIIQIFLFALTVVFVYLLVLNIINQRAAAWAAVIVALFYGLANQAGNITTETLFTFLIVLFVYALFKYFHNWNYGSIWWFAVSGIVLGLAVLTRGIIQLFFIFVILGIFLIYRKKISFKKIAIKAGIFLCGFAIILIPWVARNRLINAGAIVAPRAGEILFARAELMENLYRDYPAHFIGHLLGYYFAQKIYPDVNSSTFRETPYTDKRVIELSNENKNPAEIDSILTKEATVKILKEPHKYFLMSVLDFISFNSPIIPRGDKWQNTLTIHPMFAEGRHTGISGWVKAGIILSIRFIWFAFLFFVVYGLVKNFKKWDKIGWVFLIIIYFNLAYSAVHAIPRYALPIYPFYVILAIAGLLEFYAKNKQS